MRKYNKFFISELENDIVVAPSEKQKTDINYRYYIICQQHLANEKQWRPLNQSQLKQYLNLYESGTSKVIRP